MRKVIVPICVAALVAACSAPVVPNDAAGGKLGFAAQGSETTGVAETKTRQAKVGVESGSEAASTKAANITVLSSKNSVPDAAEGAEATTPRRPLFAGLFRTKKAEPTPTSAPVNVQLSALEGEAMNDATQTGVLAQTVRKRAPRRSDSTSVDLQFGESPPFGVVGRVCGVKSSQLGARLEKSGRGRSYAIYDSAPGATYPRAFYVTGFRDGCARQVTAALVMFGAPSMHEALRYGRPSDIYPYSATDKAYEKVKASVCKVSRRKPCGGRIKQLERDTVFVSTYERFTNNGRWADVLLHDGKVMAASIKTP